MNRTAYDSKNLRYNAKFETEVFPHVFWVPVSYLGKTNWTNQQLALQKAVPTALKERMNNPYEFIQYIQAVDFQEHTDVSYTMQNGISWETHTSGEEALHMNRGSCSSISGAFYYLLNEKFNHTGILCAIANSGVGHTFNFVQKEDNYYFIDPYVQMNRYVSYIPIETGLKKDFARTRYVSGVCLKTKCIEGFISFFEKYHYFRKREFIYFLYYSDCCPPVSITAADGTLSLILPRQIELLPFKGSKITYSFGDCHEKTNR